MQFSVCVCESMLSAPYLFTKIVRSSRSCLADRPGFQIRPRDILVCGFKHSFQIPDRTIYCQTLTEKVHPCVASVSQTLVC